jgi:hypothetical protein
VVFGHLATKAGAAAIQQLRDQTDLWRQQQSRTPLLQAGGRRLQVHLGLAGAGDTPEQQLGTRRRALNRRQRRSLIGCELAGGLQWPIAD